MGAFYGSAQVRSEDRDRVKAVAEDVARRLKIHMLIGPVLNGWIGIYPEGSGQDQQVGEALFQGLTTTVWHVSPFMPPREGDPSPPGPSPARGEGRKAIEELAFRRL